MAGEVKYRVLARKYRPQVFKELIGQDALVRTISNCSKQAGASVYLDGYSRRWKDLVRPHYRARF